jgi:hypothetical protein
MMIDNVMMIDAPLTLLCVVCCCSYTPVHSIQYILCGEIMIPPSFIFSSKNGCGGKVLRFWKVCVFLLCSKILILLLYIIYIYTIK